MKVRWRERPEDHDFPAAVNYLTLLADPIQAGFIITNLASLPIVTFKAKDILRASQLPLLDDNNSHVRSDLGKIKSGVELSPILLIRGDLRTNLPAVIADGYHRVCASYHVDENTDIPCLIVGIAR